MSTPHVRWRIVLILCALAFVLYVDRINIAVAAPHIASEFSLSRQSLGNILSSFLFGYALGLVPGGWMADRFGPYPVLTAAAFCWAVISALTFFTPVFIAFVVARSGWRESFLAAGAVTLLVALWWALFGTSDPSRHSRVTKDELSFIHSERGDQHVRRPDRAWYGRLVLSRNTYFLLASELFYGLAIFVVITWFYIYFSEVRQMGPMRAAGLSSLPYLAMAIGAPAGGFLSDIAMRHWEGPWGRRIVPIAVLSASGTCAILAPLVPSATASATLFVLGAGFQFAAAAAFWATVIDITRRGTGILGGLMNASGNLGQALGTISFPWFVGQLGWQTALQIAGACSILSGLLWIFIDSSRQLDALDERDCLSMQSPLTQ